MKARRISRPSSVRIGTFCRFGSRLREPARRRRRLAELRVDAAGRRMHQRRQRVEIRALQLLQAAPVDHLARQIVGQRQLLEHVLRRRRRLRGAGALERRQLQLHEQHVAELLGRVDVEALAGDPVDALGALVELGFEARGLAGEDAGVDADAGPLERDEHGDQRPLERLVDRRERGGLHLLRDDRRDLRGQVGALAGPRQQRRRRHRAGRDRLGALADDRLERAGAIRQQLERDRVQLRLGAVGVEQVAGELGVDVDAGQRHAVLGEDDRRLLEAVADLLHRGVLEQRAQRGRHAWPGRVRRTAGSSSNRPPCAAGGGAASAVPCVCASGT